MIQLPELVEAGGVVASAKTGEQTIPKKEGANTIRNKTNGLGFAWIRNTVLTTLKIPTFSPFFTIHPLSVQVHPNR